jgi:N-acyl-D-aspartate/D-glutamate deacylase
VDYDLKIINGTIVDGSGAPGYRGDVGVRDGRIVALGDVSGTAARTIDAAGRVVAPGFVDIHTHYDAQILWDPLLTVSPWHGVTSVVMGNCGFTLAPTRREHRDLIMRTFERVEGMSLETLKQGMGEEWGFETYPEYLDAIEKRGSAINVASQIGHTALRLNVMGLDAVEREATDAEIASMQAIVAEAIEAGAIGFSTSVTSAHFGFDGKPIASRLSNVRERLAMADALRTAGSGIYRFMAERSAPWEELIPIAKASGGHVVLGVVTANQAGPGSHRATLAVAAELVAAGIPIYPQTAGRPVVFEMDMRQPAMLFMWPSFKRINLAKTDQMRRDIYTDEDFRHAFRQEATSAGQGNPAFQMSFSLIELSWYPLQPELEGRRLVELAAERGVHPADLLVDLALAADFDFKFRMPVAQFDEAGVEEIFRDRTVVVGLGDAGAHVNQLCDACYTTHLLGYWMRTKGVLTLERAVQMLTSHPAQVFGLSDRGLLASGRPADIVVFDPETVGAGPLERVYDMPGGADRLVSRPNGIDAVIVNGCVLPPPGEAFPDGVPLPGKLLRHGHA